MSHRTAKKFSSTNGFRTSLPEKSCVTGPITESHHRAVKLLNTNEDNVYTGFDRFTRKLNNDNTLYSEILSIGVPINLSRRSNFHHIRLQCVPITAIFCIHRTSICYCSLKINSHASCTFATVIRQKNKEFV